MLIIILIPYLFLETYISLHMLESIGAFWATIWTIGTIIIGLTLLKNSPYAVLGNMHSLQRGKLNVRKFQDATNAYLIGSFLLIVPGVLSDFIGISSLLYTVYLRFIAKITPERTNHYTNSKGDNDVIDVEIVDEHTDRYDSTER